MSLKYLIIGAGGTGAVLGRMLYGGGKDAALIARGEHLAAIKEKGLHFKHRDGEEEISAVPAFSAEEYEGEPDVIIVCVKDYSLESTYPLIQRFANEKTIILPILNVFGTGDRMQKVFKNNLVLNGCIYVSAGIAEPGIISQSGKGCRLFFGIRDESEMREELLHIEADLNECGVKAKLTDNIKRDALRKFSYVSPAGAAAVYHECTAGAMQKEGEERNTFIGMVKEVLAIAEAMGVKFDKDLVEVNLKLMDANPPGETTSMQRDILAGRLSEADGLILRVIRLGREYGVPTPLYELCAGKLGLV